MNNPVAPVLSLVMPGYNEEAVLAGVLEEAVTALASGGVPYEIVLADDASTDRSPQILEAFRSRHPDTVRLLRNPTNQGIVATFERLYAAARGQYVFLNS